MSNKTPQNNKSATLKGSDIKRKNVLGTSLDEHHHHHHHQSKKNISTTNTGTSAVSAIDLKKLVTGNQYGFNLLHQCCARNSIELLYLLISTVFPQLVSMKKEEEEEEEELVKISSEFSSKLEISNSSGKKKQNISNDLTIIDIVNKMKDNYGRTPIFWSFWSGSWRTALLLVKTLKNTRMLLKVQDLMKETPIHISVLQNGVKSLRIILYWILKELETEDREQSKLFLELLEIKNSKGLTPIELSRTLQRDEMTSFLLGFQKLCKYRVKQMKPLGVIKDIKMSSGIKNGNSIYDLDDSIKVIKMYMNTPHEKEVSKVQKASQRVIISIKRKNNDNLRVYIPLEDAAYLILESKKIKVEFTLLKKPLVEKFNTKTQKWEEDNTTIFENTLSFHCYLRSSISKFTKSMDCGVFKLSKLNRFIRNSKILNEFQSHCYCYKPKSTDSRVNKEGKSYTSSLKQNIKSTRIVVTGNMKPNLSSSSSNTAQLKKVPSVSSTIETNNENIIQ